MNNSHTPNTSHTNLRRVLQKARGYLFDLDGTVYLGGRLLPGASELLGYLHEQKIPFFFLTNNSSKSVTDYAAKLQRLGLPFDEKYIFSSGAATALYLKKKSNGARLYVVGTPSLEAEFTQHGFILDDRDPQYAVLGFDTTLTYQKLQKLCDFLRAGIPYIATHPDINCPTENGFMPDIGSFFALIKASTGRSPDVIVGKPHAPIVEVIAEKTGLPLEALVMVGDRLYTDIALGKAGINTILVFSGEASPEDLEASQIKPDAAAADLMEIYRAI